MCQKAKPKKIGFPFTLGLNSSFVRMVFLCAFDTAPGSCGFSWYFFLSPLWISREMKTFAFAGLDRALILNECSGLFAALIC